MNVGDRVKIKGNIPPEALDEDLFWHSFSLDIIEKCVRQGIGTIIEKYTTDETYHKVEFSIPCPITLIYYLSDTEVEKV